MRRWWFLALVAIPGCAPITRARRALAPEAFVTPHTDVGQLARVTVDAGWPDEPARPYLPEVAFERDGVTWVLPVALTDYGRLEVRPQRPDVTVGLYVRHVGLIQRDFQRVLTRSGTLRGELPTAIRFEPTGALGDRTYTVEVRDLQNVYSDDRLEDGDLVMIEVRAPGEVSERYLFRAFEFGWRTRVGAAVLFPVPTPFVQDPQDVVLSPAFTASVVLGYRARTRRPGLSFVSEQLGIVGSVGIGSTVLEQQGLQNQLSGAFNAALVGGGIDILKLFSVQALVNASAPLRNDLESGWTLAVGFDAVQFARFTDHLVPRLLHENPMSEDHDR
jgi:hypothetical protein